MASFHLKKIALDLEQDRSTMRVGTDSILLGNWATSDSPSRILDIGTGCGVLALMMAQKFPAARIKAIDVHVESVEEAAYNFDQSPWKGNLRAFQMDVRQFEPGASFDLIIANPPFFTSGKISPWDERQLARSAFSLSFKELLRSVDRLLSVEGTFAVIFPYEEYQDFLQFARWNHLYSKRTCFVRPRPGEAIIRVMVEFGRVPGYGEEGEWCVREGYGK